MSRTYFLNLYTSYLLKHVTVHRDKIRSILKYFTVKKVVRENLELRNHYGNCKLYILQSGRAAFHREMNDVVNDTRRQHIILRTFFNVL